ncbi:MAG: HAMP domain-containing protein [Deltaproteobacteria bacterium]|jgi:two-component system nitrogen regulation sensor histidine kinase NtrY|nr:HAMP domain-containing protein [Deltaproteobacteria bacterium]
MASTPDDRPPTPERKRRRNSYDLRLLVLAVLFLILLTVVQREVLDLGPGLSSNQGVITLVSINVSVLILGVLLFLILRGLYRIFFERMHYGNLQTKMVVSFVGLSLLPTILIFNISYRLIGQDQATWFSSRVSETLDDALSLAESALELDRRLARASLNELAKQLAGVAARRAAEAAAETVRPGAEPAVAPPDLPELLEHGRSSLKLASVELYDRRGLRLAAAGAPPPIEPEWFALTDFGPEADRPQTHKLDGGLEREARPALGPDGAAGFLAVGSSLRGPILVQVAEVSQGLARRQAALGIARPFRVARLTSLSGVTLLAIFLSIWIGSHLAGSLAAPVTELVEGTKRVAKGDLDFILTPLHQSGEMAQLVAAFNQMTAELKGSYSELDRRRRFVETVLRQVSTGVLILDLDRRPVDLNQAARAMLGLDGYEPGQGPPPPAVQKLLVQPSPAGPPRSRVFLELEGRNLSLTVSQAPLRDEESRVQGWIIAFDDLSELEKAQRQAAWREVARRIAHEVKNPLTPISLSAQRLKRRFSERLSRYEDGPVFDECADVIVRQVESMKNLVDEFSQFARLPAVAPRPADLVKTVEESLALIRAAHPAATFSLTVKRAPELFLFDPEQIGRAVTNLLINAAKAVGDGGRVELTVDLDELTGASLTVADDGPGLPAEVRERVFEPYVSGSSGGQGLGLSIVNAIVRDHGGFIRVADNRPHGTVFAVTLPCRRS